MLQRKRLCTIGRRAVGVRLWRYANYMPLVSPQGFQHNMPLIKPSTSTEFFIRYITPKPNTGYKVNDIIQE